jgi:hypothetical protein
MAKTTSLTQSLPAIDLKQIDARDEMNFAEFPIALLSDRAPVGVSSLEFQDTIRDQQTGEMILRTLTIDAPERFGLPTASDDEVILGLIQLTKLRNNFTERVVHFSRYELIQLLGWPNHGASYKRLEESFDRWIRVTLDYKRAWWDKQQNGWVDEKFHVIERFSLFDSAKEIGKPVLPFSSFTWNDVVFNSFQSGYLKSLDLDFYLGLHFATARRMYRFLDKRFYKRSRLEFDLADFAFEHIGMSRSSCQTKLKGGKSYPNLSKVKEKLAQGIEELEAKGFLEPLPVDQRYVQVRRGEWKIIVQRKEKSKPALVADAQPPATIQALVAHGVTAKVAEELVAKYPPDRIARHIEVLEWMLQQAKGQEMQNPGGWLTAAIRDDYAPPKGFIPRAERDRRAKVAEETKAKRKREQETSRRKDEAERIAKKARQSHVDAYLATLSDEEKQVLEERAVNTGDEFQQRVIRGNEPGASMLKRILIENEILRLSPMM